MLLLKTFAPMSSYMLQKNPGLIEFPLYIGNESLENDGVILEGNPHLLTLKECQDCQNLENLT